MNTGIQDAWNLGWKLALVDRGLANAALLDSYQPERWPIGRFVLRFTDRATAIATSGSPVVRLIRTQVAPRLAPLVLRLRVRAYGYRTLAQLRINYRGSPAVHEGQPALRRGPRAGDRLPDARIVDQKRECWLQEALATPSYHLLLCGPAESWNSGQLAAMGERYAGLVAMHHLAREAAAGVLHDARGEAFARLGVEQAAQYLVRPDGHIGYGSAGTDLRGLEHYLARWFSVRHP
jgi:FAD binding domain/Aromatic-ring hydroxylase, C-terminal